MENHTCRPAPQPVSRPAPSHSSAKALAGALRSLPEHLLAPRRCLVCGRSLEAAVLDLCEAPVLCAGCRESLPRIEGELCRRCGVPLISELGLCTSCRELQSSLDGVRALYAYREGAVSLIHALKEGGELPVARFLAGEIVAAALLSSATSLLVPIPPSRRGKRRRGFDHSLILARALSRRTGVPRRRLLSRRGGGAQKELSREKRLSNVATQLRLRSRLLRGGLRLPEEVTLIDDVVTTGATLEAAATLLKTAGVARVRAVVIARD
ncbi:MAG: ComF family protein [Spirochaetaceae bacterium]